MHHLKPLPPASRPRPLSVVELVTEKVEGVCKTMQLGLLSTMTILLSPMKKITCNAMILVQAGTFEVKYHSSFFDSWALYDGENTSFPKL